MGLGSGVEAHATAILGQYGWAWKLPWPRIIPYQRLLTMMGNPDWAVIRQTHKGDIRGLIYPIIVDSACDALVSMFLSAFLNAILSQEIQVLVRVRGGC